MKTFSCKLAYALLAPLAAFALAFAPSAAQAQPGPAYSQQALEQMLAPIALYPDALLSQILLAATRPLEVIEAARWVRDRTDLSGDAALRAAETEDWDESVKSLLAFPLVLERLRENLQWTEALGDAFLLQQDQVMDTVQALRRQAQAAGSLRSDGRVSVIYDGPNLLLHPADPQVVYVPYYDPLLAYGSWRWPAYPPVYLRPWPGYSARPAYAGSFHWTPPVRVSTRASFGAIDWRRRQFRVIESDKHRYGKVAAPNPTPTLPQTSAFQPGTWRRAPQVQLTDHVHPRPSTFPALSRSEQARVEFRPSPGTTRHEAPPAAVARHEPALRHTLPPARAAHAAIPPPQAATRHETGAKMHDNRQHRQHN